MGNDSLYGGTNNKDTLYANDDYSIIKQTLENLTLPASVNHNQIADVCLTYAIRATAGLLYYFASEANMLPTVNLSNSFKWGIVKYQGNEYRIRGANGIGFLAQSGVPVTFKAINQFVYDTVKGKKYIRVFDNWTDKINILNFYDTTLTINITRNISFEAFLPKQYQLCLTDADYMEPSSGGSYIYNGANVGANCTRYVKDNSPLINSVIQAVPPPGWAFLKWNDDCLSNPRSISFIDDITLSASYKGIQKTSCTTAYANNGQRKFIRTSDGNNGQYLHQVYESMGKIWYERSNDNGQTWEIMNGGQALSSDSAKSPSIASYFQCIAIAYQKKTGTAGSLVVKFIKADGTIVTQSMTYYNNRAMSYNDNMNPVISWDAHGAVVFEFKATGVLGFNGLLIWPFCADGYNSFTMGSACSVSGTDANSHYPSIGLVYEDYPKTFSLCWQQNNGIYSNILFRYLQINNAANYTVTQGAVSNISQGCGLDINTRPCVKNGPARVVWTGEDSEMPGDVKTVVFKDPDNPNFFRQFGNPVSSPVIAHQNYGKYYIGWSQPAGSGYDNYWVDNTLNWANIKQIPNGHGSCLQLADLSVENNARASVLSTSAAPYSFATLPLNQSQNENSTDYAIATAVQGSAGFTMNIEGEEQYVSFNFAIGDITVNDEPVTFKNIEESVRLNSLESMEQYLCSEPFVLENNSEFIYSVSYQPIGDPSYIQQLFSLYGGSLRFRLILADNDTEEEIAWYDEVVYDASNYSAYNNTMYHVSCQGIGSRHVKLMLKIWNTVSGGEVVPVLNSMSVPFTVNGGLSKVKELNSDGRLNFWKQHGALRNKNGAVKEMNYLGKQINGKPVSVITEYALGQNFPNPFNPSTTINYQVLKAGKVVIKLYDMLGKEITTVVNENKEKGQYSVVVNAQNLSSGVYVYEMRCNDFCVSKKLTVLK